MEKKINVDIEQGAIEYVKRFKESWDTSTAFVTEKVAFEMKNLIRELRKNYWSIFNSPYDPITGRKKIFIPLTESTVETAVKNIDLDTKDIDFYSREPGKSKLTTLYREITKENLEKIGFGETLNQMERDLCIDGTAVWKIMETKKDGKVIPDIRKVDLLNFYIDPVARSIEDAPLVIERSVITQEELDKMDGWINIEDVQAQKNVNLYDGEYSYGASTSETEYIEIYELWGEIPKKLITGSKDNKEMVDGHIVVSNLTTGARVHLIEENPSKVKPYEEFWYTRVSGRWYGRGIAEKVMMLQLWMNTIVNIRINRSYVSQLGLFKIRKGQGITPQMIGKLPVNGALLVNQMDDIEQMMVQEASQASYTDEANIYEWSQRVTSAFESVTGETMASTTTATVGAIQSRSAASEFLQVKEGVGLALERVFRNHVLKIINKNIKKGDVVRLSLDGEELRALDEEIIDLMAYKYLKTANEYGYIVAPEELEEAKLEAAKQLQRTGKDRFVELVDKMNLSDFDIKVNVSNEQIDKNVLVQNLVGILQMAPEYRQVILEQIFDSLGLRLNLPQAQMQPGMDMMQQMMGGQQPQGANLEAQSMTDQLTQATQTGGVV